MHNRPFVGKRFLETLRWALVLSCLWGVSRAHGQTVEENAPAFRFEKQADRLQIRLHGRHIVDFVYQDDAILRPYFANARLTHGVQVTRNHPPINGEDADDHATMHPGIWLAFGDISQHDFWRNKASIEHLRFLADPVTTDGEMRFSTECQLKTAAGLPLATLTNSFVLSACPHGWLLIWDAVIRADAEPIIFGDQEEMGFAARIATPFTEKNGGVIQSSTGKVTAQETWGQPAMWCDYSGSGDASAGILLMASPANFRESWWHNRDYGVFVANPFGREAMKQGPRSALSVPPGEPLQITFGAFIHDSHPVDFPAEFERFQRRVAAME